MSRSPHFRSQRRGVSLLEVLFSMLLVTVGLFGAIALIPVAAQQAKRGRIADAQAIVGESAISEFFVRDMARSATWIAPSDPAYFKAFVQIQRIDPMTGMPMVDGMGNPVYRRQLIDYFPVVGYCLDPMFVDANRPNPSSPLTDINARYFPYYPRDSAMTVSTNTDSSYSVRMERLTFARSAQEAYQLGPDGQPGVAGVDDDNDGITDRDPMTMVIDQDEIGWPSSDDFRNPMTLAHAQSIFYSEDDLYLDKVKDVTIPASQVFSRVDDGMGNVTNMRRLAESNLSWFATLAPRNVNNPDPSTNDDYMLSVIVLYRRPYNRDGLTLNAVSSVTEPCAERVLEVFWPAGSTGIGGGEVILRARPGRANGDLDVRAGDWVMLSGSYDSTFAYGSWVNPAPGPPVPTNKRPIYQWYRVIEADTDIETRTIGMNTFQERSVTLAGSDWPTNMVRDGLTASTLSLTQATVVSGVVGVYEKTVRLNFK